MAYDGHLSFDTKLDEKGFTSGVGKLGGIAKSALGILGGAVAGVTGAMGAGVAMGVKYNADMQNYFSNFETMLGSADAATAHVQELKEFAAKTPFEMSDLAQASKTLLAFGTDADDVMPIMKMLGDVSLGNKDKFNSLSLVFGQVSSQGKLMGQDLLQMINAGFNPLQVISEKTGESMASLKDRMSKGEIGIDEVTQAFQWATEEGGKFAGGMEKASQTFDGLMSTLKDNAMSLLGEVVEPITDQMTNTLLPAAIDAVDQLSAAFQEGGVEQFIAVGAGLIADIATGIAEQLPTVIETAISFINTLVTSFNENTDQLVAAGGQMITALASGLVELLPTLGTFGLNLIQSIASSVTAALPQLVPVAVSTILGFAQGLVNNLPSLIDAGLQMLLALAQGIANSLPTLIEQGPRLINSFADAVYGAIPKVLACGVEILKTLGKGIIDNIPLIVANAGEIITAIINVFSLANLFSVGKSFLKSFGEGLKSMQSFLQGIGKQVIEALKHPFDPSGWISIGKNIITGIANGIKGAMSTVVAAAKGVVKSALGAVKSFLGIHSPSRVFHDEVGKNIALGIAEGIKANKDYAKKSAEEIAQATLEAAQKKLNNWKVYNNLTEAEEVAFWDEVRKQTAEGTQARIDADEKYFKAKQNLNKDMQDAEEKYTDNVAKAYQNLNDKIKELNEQYKDAVDSRTNEIKNAYGLFDAFDSDTDLTSDDLLDNLRSQVDGLRQWEKNLDDLADRGVGDDLISELQDLGPKSAAEVQLLTEMTDDELDSYVSLFRTKNRLARKQAVEELEPMQKDIASQISQLKLQTQQELAEYQQEYMDAMAQLGAALDKPAEDMKLLMAQNAVELVATLASSVKEASGSTENTEKFKAIADNVLNASADLPQSMTTLGQNAIEGMIQGIQSKSGALSSAMSFVVNSAVSQAISAAVSGNAIGRAIDETTAGSESISLPVQNYGNEGNAPGYPIDYERMGEKMREVVAGVELTMDKQKVGSIVSEPVNDRLGEQSRREGRDMV